MSDEAQVLVKPTRPEEAGLEYADLSCPNGPSVSYID